MESFNLRQALKEFVPFDENEAECLRKTLNFVETGSNLFSRSNQLGHINSSAFLMNSDLSKLLMMHHKFLNQWFQFGGHSDGDENTMRVAAREVREESGIENFVPLRNGVFDISVNSIPCNEKKKEPAHLHFDIYFIFTTDTEKFQVSSESNSLRWFTLDEYKKLEPTEQRRRFAGKWEQLRKKNSSA